jgi:hypothetical protein
MSLLFGAHLACSDKPRASHIGGIAATPRLPDGQVIKYRLYKLDLAACERVWCVLNTWHRSTNIHLTLWFRSISFDAAQGRTVLFVLFAFHRRLSLTEYTDR